MTPLYRWTNQSNGAWIDTEEMRDELSADGVLVEVRVPSEDELRSGFQSTIEGLMEVAATPDLIAMVLAVQVRRLLGYEAIVDGGLYEREEES